VKVNTEADPSLANQFNIRSIPTLALFKSGREIPVSLAPWASQNIVSWVRAHA